MRDLIIDTVNAICARYGDAEAVRRAEAPGWNAALWKVLGDQGMTLVGIPESAGGPGGGLNEVAAMVEVLARHAASVPFTEHHLACRMLAEVGIEIPAGPLTICPPGHIHDLKVERAPAGGWRLTGRLERVPWARLASAVVVPAGSDDHPITLLVPIAGLRLTGGSNLAGEPRDQLDLDGARVAEAAAVSGGLDSLRLAGLGATLRSVAIGAACGTVLELSTSYLREREQFGRPLARFQVLQHYAAEMVAETMAAQMAAEGAVEAAGAPLAAAFAKSRAGRAAGTVATLAHQVHGAIGFTDEHRLHHFTRRLWAWRDEFGSEAHWNRLAGAALASAPAGAWSLVTSL